MVVFDPTWIGNALDLVESPGVSTANINRQLGVSRNLRRAGLSEPKSHPDPGTPPKMGYCFGQPIGVRDTAAGLGTLAIGFGGNAAWPGFDCNAKGLVRGSHGLAISRHAERAPGLCRLDALNVCSTNRMSPEPARDRLADPIRERHE